MFRWLLSLVIVLVFIVGGYLPLSIMWRETRKLQSNTPFGGRFVKIKDGVLYTQILGYPEQPAIVVLPGEGEWSETWKPVMRYLAQEGYRVITIDLPPFGFSYTVSKDFSREAQARRFNEALIKLKLKSFILIAHSEAVPAALSVTKMLGDKVKGFVIVSAKMGWPQKEGGMDKPISAMSKWAFQTKLFRKVIASYYTHYMVLPNRLKKRVYSSKVINSNLATIYLTPFLYRGTNAKISEWLRQSQILKNNKIDEDRNEFKDLKIPTLLIWGDRDKESPAWQGRKLKEFMPQAQFLLMSKVGHLPHIENEKSFDENILSFASTIQAPVQLH